MSRALLLVLDSLGCGGAQDAPAFGDAGADTFGHIVEACALGRGNREGLRQGPLRIPFLTSLGLRLAAEASRGHALPGVEAPAQALGLWGHAVETSLGKDTPSGHWEIVGAPADFAWGYFPNTQPSFPVGLTQALIGEGGLPGILGDCHASGTDIIEELGLEHMRSGKPIAYTSVDSVLQIAAHEESFGLERLYDLCRLARRLCDPLRIGRIIARPFVGDAPGAFHRTPRRKDFAMPPAMGNLLDRAAQAHRPVVSIGKIGDIFAHRNTGEEIKGAGNMDLFDKTLAALDRLPDGGLIFANYLDLDTEFGHRRDVPGAAACLEAFDARMAELATRLRPGDLVVFTGDHGNDPTWRGTDHTREHVPVLAFGPGIASGPLGARPTFADIGASIAAHLGLAAPVAGRSWW
jgi:phosphopentomutase